MSSSVRTFGCGAGGFSCPLADDATQRQKTAPILANSVPRSIDRLLSLEPQGFIDDVDQRFAACESAHILNDGLQMPTGNHR